MPETTRQAAQKFTLEVLRDFMTLLSDPSTVCTLHVGDGFNERVIYFCSGGVRLLSVGDRQGPDIVDVLLEQGRIDVEVLHQVLEKVRGGQASLKGVLEAKGVIGREEFDAINTKLIRDAIFDLVFWEDAFFKTYPTSPPAEMFTQGRQALTASIDFIGLGGDALRWIELWSKLKGRLRSDSAPIMLTSQGRKALRDGKSADRELLNLCEGGTTLRVLRRLSRQELPELAQALHGAVRERWITVLRPEDAGRSNAQAIVELEEALPRVIDGELAREKLVHLYTLERNAAKASEHLAALAHAAQAADDLDAAAERWHRVLALRETDEAAFKELVEVYIDARRDVEIAELAERFARALGREGHTSPRDAVDELLQRIPKVRSLSDDFQRAWTAAKRNLGLGEEGAPAPRARACAVEAAVRVPRGPLVAVVMFFLVVLCAGSWALWHFGLVEIPDLAALVPFGAKTAAGESPDSGQPVAESVLDGGVPAPRDGRPAFVPGNLVRQNGDGTVTTPFGILPAPPHGLPPGLGEIDEEEWNRIAEELYLTAEPPSFDLGEGNDFPALPPIQGGGFFGGFGTRPADRSDSPDVSTPPLAQQIRERAQPKLQPRPRPALSHVPWGVNEGLEASLVEGSLRIVDRTTSERVLDFPGTAGDRWVITPGAALVCRWRPGRSLAVHRRITGETVETTWKIPHSAEALVVADGFVAVCEGDVTAVYHHDGTPIVRRLVPRWRDGFFAGNVLVCLPAATQSGEPRARMYLASSLDLVWAGCPLGWGG